MRALIVWGLVNTALLAACREQPSPGAAASTSASAKTSSVVGPPSASGPVAVPSASAAPVRTAEIEALIERWRAAQNAGDFASYEKLYAEKFVGIKRVGMQTFRFDRKRWLLDRKGMLAHKPEVGVKNLGVVDLGKTAAVRFEQTFTAKSFRDVGTKLLVLLEEGGELKIGREEMLTSLVATPPGVVSFPDFAFVVHQGGKPYVLLEKRERDPAAPIEYVDLESALSPIKDEQSLPSERRGLAQRELVLYGEAGELCRSRVTRVVTWRAPSRISGSASSGRVSSASHPPPGPRSLAIWSSSPAAPAALLLSSSSRSAGASRRAGLAPPIGPRPCSSQSEPPARTRRPPLSRLSSASRSTTPIRSDSSSKPRARKAPGFASMAAAPW